MWRDEDEFVAVDVELGVFGGVGIWGWEDLGFLFD